MSESSFQAADEVFRAEMPSRLEERETMIERVMLRLSSCGCRLDQHFDRLCLDEAISNAILHGNRSDPSKRVGVLAYSNAERWGVEITDEGSGFDWKALLALIEKGPDTGSRSGRGIALIVASGAEIEFREGGRSVLISRMKTDRSSSVSAAEGAF